MLLSNRQYYWRDPWWLAPCQTTWNAYYCLCFLFTAHQFSDEHVSSSCIIIHYCRWCLPAGTMTSAASPRSRKAHASMYIGNIGDYHLEHCVLIFPYCWGLIHIWWSSRVLSKWFNEWARVGTLTFAWGSRLLLSAFQAFRIFFSFAKLGMLSNNMGVIDWQISLLQRG